MFSRALSAQLATRLCLQKRFPDIMSSDGLVVLPQNDVQLEPLGITPG